MTPSSWARISDLFEQAVDLPKSTRAAFLDDLRRRDEAAATELASLLEAHDRPGAFLPVLPGLEEPPDLSGRVVGAYRLLRPLGAGGTGVVYLAERSDGAFAKQVAVKLLSAAFQHSRDRFMRERRILAGLEHPNIARLLDAGTTPDHVLFLVMEHVEGVPIDRFCVERQATVEQRVAVLRQVCAGVAHAHRSLVVHCDIKPENVLVTADGDVKLLDFGIARLLDPTRAVTILRPATPAYSSPEQLRGDAITTASDVYSLGVLAYVVLSGQGPYGRVANRVDEVLHAALTATPSRVSDAPGLPGHYSRRLKGDLDNILAKAVAREPERRYASVEQLAEDLDAFLRGYPVRARPATLLYRLQRTIGRHRLSCLLGGGLGLALIAAIAISVREAQLAERRFNDLRAFARTVVFDVNDRLAPIPGTTDARKLVVQTALQYLDRLTQDGVSEAGLREELAAAYLRIGKVQGGAFLPNLGDSAGAIDSFRKAMAVTAGQRSPVLERLRIDALISVAQLSVDPIDGVPELEAAVRAAEHLLTDDGARAENLRLLADAYHGRATVAHLTNDVTRHAGLARRQIEVRQRLRDLGGRAWQDDASLARAMGQLALALEQEGDYPGALAQLDRAESMLVTTMSGAGPNQILDRGLAEIRSRKAPVLLALGRAGEGATEVQRAIALLEPLVTSDTRNVQYRADLGYAWLRLGDVRRAQGRVAEALELHRRALAVRRERADRHGGFIFVPWELTRSLNALADLLLAGPAPNAAEAAALFAEARTVGLRTLEQAPSYTQVRKQVAIAEEGLARAAMAGGGREAVSAAILLRQSAERWREVASRSSGDARGRQEVERLEQTLIATSQQP